MQKSILIRSFLTLFLICISALQASAQKRSITDTLSHDIIEKLFKKDPKVADCSRSSFNAYPYAYYTPESQFAFGAGGIIIFTSDPKKS